MGRALIVVAGPTGSGKTSLALDIAEALSGEIVNCDSLQLYRGFDVGTAKTPVAARRDIPHHLFDVREASDGYSAGDYARLARRAIAEIAATDRLPIVVGGSGFYLRALLEGLPDLPSRDAAVRERLEARERHRPGSLHRLLTRLEPAAAQQIHPRDVQKVMRALEIRLLTGAPRPHSETADRLNPIQANPIQGHRILKLGLNPDRSQLYERLDARVQAMFSGGLIEEVRALMTRGVTGDEKPFESLGYRQAVQYIRGEASLDQAILSTQLGTRQYAKRQWTWYRRDAAIHWLTGFGDQPEVARQALVLATGLSKELAAEPTSGYTKRK